MTSDTQPRLAEPDVAAIPREVLLSGGHNFRDAGGYATVHGRRLRTGLLFRSGMMASLTPDDIRKVRALGLRTICDLRTPSERSRQPTLWPGVTFDGMLVGDAPKSAATLAALLAAPSATEQDVRTTMMAIYRDLPFAHLPLLGALFRRIGEAHGPVLIHCAAGKDRTGVAMAIVHRALSVPLAAMEEDFLTSNVAIDVDRLLRETGLGRAMLDRPVVARAIMQVRPEYLHAALEAIDQRHGSFEAYLSAAIGLSNQEVQAFRDAILVPPPA